MANDWQMVRIGDVLVQNSESVSVEAIKIYKSLGVRLAGQGTFLRTEKNGNQIQASRLYPVHAGDFIYSRLFAWRGAFDLVPDQYDGCFVSGEFPTFRIQTDQIFPPFLRLYFARPPIWEEVEKYCTGTTKASRNRFKEEFFLAMNVALPPLAEQKRIVARVDALARRVEEARGLRRAAMEEASTLISSLHLSLSGSRFVKIGDIMTLDEDRQEITFGKLYPQVGVKGFGQGLFPRETLDASQTTYKWFNRLYYGATVLSQVKGWEGAIAVCLSELAGKYVSPEYRTFRCISGQAIPEYLSELFSTRWFWIQLKDLGRGVGGRRERLRPERFIEMKLPMPSVNDQKRAVEIFEKVKSLRPLQAATQKELDALMPSILAKAFAGEL